MPQASLPAKIPAATDRVTSQDRVTWIVRGTLLVLLVIGVLTVFGDSLLGLSGEPPESPPTAPAPALSSPAGQAPGSALGGR
jgi:hypothetical protein